MLPEKRIPTHPGEVLLMEFLTPMGLTQVEFAKHLNIPIQRLNEITRGKRGVSPETAWLFAQALGTSPEFWLNLQTAHDLAKAHPPKPVATVAALDKHRKARESRTIYRITGEERSGSRSNKSASRKGRS
jgi:addiction module HigA family antidote